ncbi:uncharacterized protein Z518_06135 [Rhinocladiella mackenziei CBS 650.93]|uniref:FAD-binding domain-containing protein n=1 Tax=Rhinocladiella mackenziei CBS 650.93 TaxID=1442369 RepID=A0A0D2H4C2_9EURO|nr:uncharacterized protein Z518_06135 [Rhinocladiella mackenziei CBS 650.93]KIX05263.1 hypothetical protein Z518_06135 [Rhinocladiella mackenziei CBS 650.93]
MRRPSVQVGIIGAGMGGLAAGIAMARAGAQVTLLEAASELGEIGAGIQMVPNVSRFLIRWGVDKIIGDNLVLHDECNTWDKSELVAWADPKVMAKNTGFPWWVVRRDHLHAGLSESAKRHGAKMVVNARVCKIGYVEDDVEVETTGGDVYRFHLVIGADGIRSFMRQQLFPGVMPKATSKVAAYRGVLSYDKIFAEVPEARSYLRNTMDVWSGMKGYVLTYPISGGKECNIVTAFCKDYYVTQMEEVDINEFREYYKDLHPIIQKVIRLVPYTQRWPLLQMPKMERWSNEKRNVVLLGDAAHCMQNHMAQGAATAVEDGAFLGRVISGVVRGAIDVPKAVELYENRRIPKAWIKQQISFVSGIVNMTSEEERLKIRDKATRPEIWARDQNPVDPPQLPPAYRSWQFYSSENTMPGLFYYDAEGDADNAVCEYLQSVGEVDDFEMLSANLKNMWTGYVDNNGTTIEE